MDNLLARAVGGERLSGEEGLRLYYEADLLSLGRAADRVRRRLHPQDVVTFVVDRNINYTNVCQSGCLFCAFYRREEDPEAYLLTHEEILAKIEELVAQGGTQVLIQGGLHPRLGLAYFTTLFRRIKAQFPVHIHSLSPPEVVHLARLERLSVRDVLLELKASGLDSLPGGGAEILVNRVRQVVSPRKITWQEWVAVMVTAFELGLFGTATMMFGTVERPEDRVQHILRIREVQDKTGGFTAFIPWTYQPGNTALGGKPVPAVEYLRMLALSRLLLDNVRNLQASWVTQGAKVGQVALAFGANDFGGTMLEENVVRAAGASYRVPPDEIRRVIRDAGFVPAQRTTDYRILRVF
ncbi:MAG: cyclic dehypoxanthinyl futalosine synthase [Thermoanaerobacteraceae bacterium]|nr:cyclic dehypoxanthinyl futalosine synthase [Thermoanaerobacteraceae bacterium]